MTIMSKITLNESQLMKIIAESIRKKLDDLKKNTTVDINDAVRLIGAMKNSKEYYDHTGGRYDEDMEAGDAFLKHPVVVPFIMMDDMSDKKLEIIGVAFGQDDDGYYFEGITEDDDNPLNFCVIRLNHEKVQELIDALY